MTSMPTTETQPSAMRRIGAQSLRVLWHVTRMPILATLLVLEPPVRVVLSVISVLGIAMTLFFEYVLHVPRFPFWLMLGISIGCATLLIPYYLLIRLFSSTPAGRS